MVILNHIEPLFQHVELKNEEAWCEMQRVFIFHQEWLFVSLKATARDEAKKDLSPSPSRPELIQQKWIKAERPKGVQIIQTNIP